MINVRLFFIIKLNLAYDKLEVSYFIIIIVTTPITCSMQMK